MKQSSMGSQLWSQFGFFTIILKCLRDGRNDDQGEGGEIQVQSPGGGKTGWVPGCKGEAGVWDVT